MQLRLAQKTSSLSRHILIIPPTNSLFAHKPCHCWHSLLSIDCDHFIIFSCLYTFTLYLFFNDQRMLILQKVHLLINLHYLPLDGILWLFPAAHVWFWKACRLHDAVWNPLTGRALLTCQLFQPTCLPVAFLSFVMWLKSRRRRQQQPWAMENSGGSVPRRVGYVFNRQLLYLVNQLPEVGSRVRLYETKSKSYG